jgi:hypothetical protein
MEIDDLADDGEGTGRSFALCIVGEQRDKLTREMGDEVWQTVQNSIRGSSVSGNSLPEMTPSKTD